LTAFYEGDSTYAEVTSPSIPMTVSDFGMTSAGATAAIGSAAIASIAVNAASNYTSVINLTCTLPSGMTESACFVNPGSITGSGMVQLTVNTTPAHPGGVRALPASYSSYFRAEEDESWLSDCLPRLQLSSH
jgi:hypothetical protein